VVAHLWGGDSVGRQVVARFMVEVAQIWDVVAQSV
jgi:hypothetical protein